MRHLATPLLAIALILGISSQARADFSTDQPPTEVPADPGDILMPGAAPWVDDGDTFLWLDLCRSTL